MQSLGAVLVIWFLALLISPSAGYGQESEALNRALKQMLQSSLDSKNVCKDVPGLDRKRKAEVRDLSYIPRATTSLLKVSLHVSCKSNGFIPARASENFRVEAELANADCRITSFKTHASGEIAKAFVKLPWIKNAIRDDLAREVDKLCHG